MTDQENTLPAKPTAEMQRLLRAIPKVDGFLEKAVAMAADAPLLMVKIAVRGILAEKRQAILAGETVAPESLTPEALLPLFRKKTPGPAFS
jgi:hypothetical protein